MVIFGRITYQVIFQTSNFVRKHFQTLESIFSDFQNHSQPGC